MAKVVDSTNLDLFLKHYLESDLKEASKDLQKTQLATVMHQNQKCCIKEIQIKKDQRPVEN